MIVGWLVFEEKNHKEGIEVTHKSFDRQRSDDLHSFSNYEWFLKHIYFKRIKRVVICFSKSDKSQLICRQYGKKCENE